MLTGPWPLPNGPGRPDRHRSKILAAAFRLHQGTLRSFAQGGHANRRTRACSPFSVCRHRQRCGTFEYPLSVVVCTRRDSWLPPICPPLTRRASAPSSKQALAAGADLHRLDDLACQHFRLRRHRVTRRARGTVPERIASNPPGINPAGHQTSQP